MNRWLDKWFRSHTSTSVCHEHSGNAKYRQPDVSASFAKSHYKPSCAWQCRPLCKVTDLEEVLKVHPVWGLNACLLSWQTTSSWWQWGGKSGHQIKIIYPRSHHELVVNVRAGGMNVLTPAASTPRPYSIQLRISRACAFSALKDDFYEHPTPLWHPTPRHPTHVASSTPRPLNPTWVKLQGSPLWKYLLVEKGKYLEPT